MISLAVTPELSEAAAGDDSLTIAIREYAGIDDIAGSQVVIASTNSPSVNAAVTADAHSLFRLVSVANSPSDGSFISMAVHRAGPLAIGVSAGNVPSAAGRIRDAIAARFDDRYGDAVAECAELRAEVLEDQGSAGWAKIHPELIGADFCARVENGTFSEEVAACRSL